MKFKTIFQQYNLNYLCLYLPLAIALVLILSFSSTAMEGNNSEPQPQATSMDNDDDGLLSDDEAIVGTDPNNPDSDGDGIRDGVDPDVLAVIVKQLPNDAFKSKGKGLRTAILSRLNNNERYILAGNIEKAIHMLENLRKHMDGCPFVADKNDWIIDCASQEDARRFLDILLLNHVSCAIDSTIELPITSLPGLDFGAERPVGTMINPKGNSETFISNEVLFWPQDQQSLNNFLLTYGGIILRDGTARLHPDSYSPPADLPDSSGLYLIQIDPYLSSLDDLAANMERKGLRGHWSFSSEEAMGTASLVAREYEKGISLNFTMELSHQKVNEHPDDSGGNLDAATWWWMTEDDDPNQPGDQGLSIGVIHAWEYVRYKGYPPSTPYYPLKLAIIDAGFDFDPTTGEPLYGAGDFPLELPQLDEVDWDYTADGMAYGFSNCPNGCWHGHMTYGACCALSQNNYGGAGTSGGWNVRPLFIKASGDMGTVYQAMYDALYNGADVIHETLGFICDWWCETFDPDEGGFRSTFKSAPSQGAIVVTPANNQNIDISSVDQIPCKYKETICVGAILKDGKPWSESNKGSNYGTIVDTWAPTGFSTTITRDSAAYDTNDVGKDELHLYGGTSASTPFVTGIVALMKMLDPYLTYSDVRDILKNTSNLSTDPKIINTGYIDACRAVKAASPNLPPVVDIIEPTNGAPEPYPTVFFKAQVTDPEVPSLSGISADFSSTIIFSSDIDGDLCSASGDATNGGTILSCEAAQLSLGNHLITATVTDPFEGVGTDTIIITVINTPPLVKITYPANGESYFSNQEINLRGYGFDEEQHGYIPVCWTSDITGQLVCSDTNAPISDIWVTLSEGTHTITLLAIDEQGVTSSDSITLSIQAPTGPDEFPTVKITEPFNGSVFGKNEVITFSGQATDPEDGDISTDADFHWSSSIDGFLGTGKTMQTNISGPVNEGSVTHSITLEVTDSAGNTSSHTINVSITQIN